MASLWKPSPETIDRLRALEKMHLRQAVQESIDKHDSVVEQIRNVAPAGATHWRYVGPSTTVFDSASKKLTITNYIEYAMFPDELSLAGWYPFQQKKPVLKKKFVKDLG